MMVARQIVGPDRRKGSPLAPEGDVGSSVMRNADSWPFFRKKLAAFCLIMSISGFKFHRSPRAKPIIPVYPRRLAPDNR